MKYLSFLAILAFLIVSCEKEDTGLEELTPKSSIEIQDEIVNRSFGQGCDNLEFEVTLISNENGCCQYEVEVSPIIKHQTTFLTFNIDGKLYSHYIILKNKIIVVEVCESSTFEFYSGNELCYSETVICQPVSCKGCNSVEFTSKLINENDGCCLYDISMKLCDDQNPGGNQFTYFRNGVQIQSLNVTSNSSLPISVCGNETVLIQIYSNRGLCFSEEFTCTTCCPGLNFNISSKNVGTSGDGCCEVTFEMTGPQSCLNMIDISFSANGQVSADLDPNPNVIRVYSCESNGVTFIAKDANGEICYEETPTIYCEE